VVIDSTLEDGALTYGECVLPGQIKEEFLFSVHICHPSLCNDNLSCNSRWLKADIDRAVEHVLGTKGDPFEVRDFSPYGYGERQYSSPGFNLPVGGFRRTPHGEHPEYHTSADNFEFVSAGHLADSLRTLLEVIDLVESDLQFHQP
jgi:aminopeptidase-like protein